jgi:hypothetical protein
MSILKFLNKFTHHPSNVCMSYLDHMKFSLSLSYLQLKGSMGGFIHAFIPWLHIDTSSRINQEINHKLLKGGCNKKSDDK